SAQQQTGQSAAPAAQKPAKAERKASTGKDAAAPPKPKVRRAESSLDAITSEPSKAAHEERVAAFEDADEEKEDEWVRLRGMPGAIAANMDASLSMPTATTVRDMPVRSEERRVGEE